MKKILSIITLLACFCINAAAQVKAGDVISGQIWDDFDPLMMCNVVEIDKNNRIVAHGVTDINGNFSFKIVSPKNKIRISYIGCQTLTLPITKKAFGKIVLKSENTIKEVTIKATRKTQNTGLSIPMTEIGYASQTIDMKEFEGIGMTTVDEALQGRIAGLDIVANSGNLGAGTTMRLRGVSTINGNQNPLVVVNGNILANDDLSEGFDFSNANEERFAELLNVNPEDIESITVLKDAAACAIWGSRGANGVIEIKTKRGTKGKTRVAYSYRFTGSWQPDGYKLLNGDEYTMFMKEAYFNPRQQSGFADKNSDLFIPEIAYATDWSEYNMYNDNTDWVDKVKQFGTNQQHYVSLTGGGEKANFRISGGYDHQTGTIITQVLNRFSTRVALDYFVSDRIKITTNFDLTYTDNDRNNTQGALGDAQRKMPNLSIYREDANGNDLDEYYTMNKWITKETGTYAATGAGKHKYLEDQYDIKNPIAVAHNSRQNERNLQLAPEFIMKYDILGVNEDQSKLTYDGQIRFDIRSNDNDSFMPGWLTSYNQFYADRDENKLAYNMADASNYKSHTLSTRHSLTYSPHFNAEGHRLMLMGRYEYSEGNSSSQNTQTYMLPTTANLELPLAGGKIRKFGSGAGEWKRQNVTFQTHYTYKGKYSLTATLRGDCSTAFGPDRRWGFFPGVSARWNISDEAFMEPVRWLSMLSIRPSFGIVGNSPQAEGLFRSKYATTGSTYMGQTVVKPNNIRLADLRWEKKSSYQIAFDFGFFDNKINGNVDIYTQTTKDLLNKDFRIPSSSGYSTLAWTNVGSMRNNGWEFNINGNQFIKVGKFSMDFNVSFSNNRNKIVEMDETLLEAWNGDFNYENGSYLSRVQINNPLGSIYGFRYLGVYQYSEYSAEEVPGISGPNAPVVRNADGEVVYDAKGAPKYMMYDYAGAKEYSFVGGDAIYEDINHDGQINELDIVYLGSSLPKVTGGFGTKFNYGNWSLNLQFNFRAGVKCINEARMNLESMATNNNQSIAINWRWHNEGDISLIPRAATNRTDFKTYNYLGSDRFVEDCSFLRLNYAQLSYTFKPAQLKSIGLNSLRLNLTMNNLFCLTKYSGVDPEGPQAGIHPAKDNSQTPRSRSFTFGLNVSF